MMESERLSFIKYNQSKLRVDKYNNLCQASTSSQTQGSQQVKRVVLPSSFIGSRRFMDQLYFDGMTICSYMGFPDLFITFTCNPKWPEITRLLAKLKLSPTDRLDIVSRVFKIKFEQLLTDLTKNHILGKTIACKSSLFVIIVL